MRLLLLQIIIFLFSTNLLAENLNKLEEVPAPTLEQLRMSYSMGLLYKNMPWDVGASIVSVPYFYPSKTEDDAPVFDAYQKIDFFNDKELEGKPLFTWEKHGVWQEGKQVCKLVMPKKKVRTKRWFTCTSIRCEEQSSDKEVELIVPDYMNYGMYSIDSDEWSQKKCPIDYEFMGDPNYMLVHVESELNGAPKGQVFEWEKLFIKSTPCWEFNVLKTGALHEPPGYKGCGDRMYFKTGGAAKYYSPWRSGVSGGGARIKQYDIKWCKGEGRSKCLQTNAFVKRLLCYERNGKEWCPEGKRWDYTIDELMRCMWDIYPNTVTPKLHGKTFRCSYIYDWESNEKFEISKIDFPEAYWVRNIDTLNYYPEKYDEKNPLIIVPEVPW